MAAPTPERLTIREIAATEFANETCAVVLQKALTALEDLRPAVDWKVARAKLPETLLWQTAHAWAEFARTGVTARVELLAKELEPYDDVSTIVCEAVACRLLLQSGKAVNVSQLGAAAGLSKIHVGNLIRDSKLPVVPDVSPYAVRASVARAFLRERTVPGFV